MSEVVSSRWCLGREAVCITWCGRWRRCLGCSNFPIDSIHTFGCHLNRKCRCVMFCNKLGLSLFMDTEKDVLRRNSTEATFWQHVLHCRIGCVFPPVQQEAACSIRLCGMLQVATC